MCQSSAPVRGDFRRSDRLLSLLAPPLGLFAPALLFLSVGEGCSEEFDVGPDGRQRLISSTCDDGWSASQMAATALFVVLVVAALVTTVRLARRVAVTR